MNLRKLCLTLLLTVTLLLAGCQSGNNAGNTGAANDNSSNENTAGDTADVSGPIAKGDAYRDFTATLTDGSEFTLSDHEGKVILLNFWATWCGPCKQEMPDIQQLYLDQGENTGDVIILGVAAPKSEDNPFNQETLDADGIADFLEEGGYTYPVLMDTTGDVLMNYGISAFPTTFMIDSDGNLFGYLQGSMTREIMDSIIDQTVTGIRAN